MSRTIKHKINEVECTGADIFLPWSLSDGQYAPPPDDSLFRFHKITFSAYHAFNVIDIERNKRFYVPQDIPFTFEVNPDNVNEQKFFIQCDGNQQATVTILQESRTVEEAP